MVLGLVLHTAEKKKLCQDKDGWEHGYKQTTVYNFMPFENTHSWESSLGMCWIAIIFTKNQLNVLGDYIAIVTTSYICLWASLSPEDLWGFGGLVTWASKKYTKVHLDRAHPRRQHLWALLVQAFSPLVKLLVNPYLFWAKRFWEYNIQRDNG